MTELGAGKPVGPGLSFRPMPASSDEYRDRTKELRGRLALLTESL